MDNLELVYLLESYKSGETSEKDILEKLKNLPFENLGYASVDHHRALRQGYPEVILCQGKTPEQIKGIARAILKDNQTGLLATRADAAAYAAVRSADEGAIYHEFAGIVEVRRNRKEISGAPVAVVTAGTADLSVAEEAACTADAMGACVRRIYDVGIAGIHRLTARLGEINGCGVVIVVAGMEGALPSVLGGLTSKPVIAVPTSTGYGASFNGLAALLAMLNSCASGITVCNIDNGFGAACAAVRILRSFS